MDFKNLWKVTVTHGVYQEIILAMEVASLIREDHYLKRGNMERKENVSKFVIGFVSGLVVANAFLIIRLAKENARKGAGNVKKVQSAFQNVGYAMVSLTVMMEATKSIVLYVKIMM